MGVGVGGGVSKENSSRGGCFVRATLGDQPVGEHLVAEGRGQEIVDHLLVEDRGEAARDGGHDPGPVGRAAPPDLLLILQVLHEGGGGSVVVHDRHLGQLGKWEGGGLGSADRPHDSSPQT